MLTIPDLEEAVVPPVLPPSPPDVLPETETEQIPLPTYYIISRPSVGTTGKHIPLLENLLKVAADDTDATFFQYSVTITSEDKRTVECKGFGRKVIDRLHQTYSSELGGKSFAYDGERTLYTVGPLPDNKFEFKVLLEETFSFPKCTESPGANETPCEENKRTKRSLQSKAFTVEISFAAKIPLQPIALALKGIESYANSQDALRVLDIILRQRATNRGCLLFPSYTRRIVS
ncbi:unnamed protein product [Lathyrus sativus]|nr:unnamed protein product [Lathyrus sativus]